MKFYTIINQIGNSILYRGVENGEPVQYRVNYQPTLFLPSRNETEWKTIDAQCVEPFNAGTMKECREFISQYQDVQGFEVYGNTQYIYPFICENHEQDLSYDMSKINIAYIDIETTCEDGFPSIEDPTEQVIAITMVMNDTRVCWGLGTFDVDGIDCRCFDDEKQLLDDFLGEWESNHPHIITGWNVRFFDIPYLVRRIERLFGDKEAKRFSPWKMVRERTIKIRNRDELAYEIVGVATLDYLELYRNYTFTNQESYKLDHISYVELGEKKLSYEEYGSIASFYKQNFQKFIEYNIRDVDLVCKLEDKLRLMELNASVAYLAKCNYEDVFSQVRTWDCIIHSHLYYKNTVVPQKKSASKDSQYAGAYVKDPIVGRHDWVVSLDLNSLYPHLIMQYNISPETKVDRDKDHTVTPKSVLNGKIPDHGDYSMAANGICFRRDVQGFLPALMEQMYADRKQAKNKMIDCQKRQQSGEDTEKEIAKWGTMQMALKIALNSAYGALGNQYFRYFDIDMAEAITLSGQLSIQYIANEINAFLNKTLDTGDYDYVVASDTDSVYLRLGNLVDKVVGTKSQQEVVVYLDKAMDKILLPFIREKYQELAETMNAYDNKMVMDREVIADSGIWTAKKRYILHVHNSEGVQYDEPKLKIMGIETTRSSTPEIVRKRLKDAIKLIMTTDEKHIVDFIEKFREDFYSCPAELVSFPRGVRGLDKYSDPQRIYRKSTPIAVKGSLLWNHMLRKKGLHKQYPEIKDYDKIKFVYLKVPNPVGDQVISFPDYIPEELDIHDFVDYEKQFEKSFLDPLRTILDVIGWKTENVGTLEDLFI